MRLLILACGLLLLNGMTSAQEKKEPSYQGKSLSVWVAQLKDPGVKQRAEAAKAIGRFGPDGLAAMDALVTAMKDKEVEVRQAAIGALNFLPEDAKAVPALIAALKDSSPQVRAETAKVLETYAPFAVFVPEVKTAIPALIEALKDSDPQVGARSANALGWFRKDAKTIVPPLVEALKNPDWGIRSSAAFSLGLMGPEAKPAVPLLIQQLKGKIEKGKQVTEDVLRRNAARALGRITKDSDVAVVALIEAMKDPGLEVPEVAITALGEIGPAAKDAIGPLTARLKDDKKSPVRIHAAASLARIDPKYVKPAMAILIESLNSSEGYIRASAVDALDDLGPLAKEAVPELIKLLKDKDTTLSDRAGRALRRIDKEAAQKAGVMP